MHSDELSVLFKQRQILNFRIEISCDPSGSSEVTFIPPVTKGANPFVLDHCTTTTHLHITC